MIVRVSGMTSLTKRPGGAAQLGHGDLELAALGSLDAAWPHPLRGPRASGVLS